MRNSSLLLIPPQECSELPKRLQNNTNQTIVSASDDTESLSGCARKADLRKQESMQKWVGEEHDTFSIKI